MAFWNRKKNWEDDYDSYYSQDRRLGYEGRRGGKGLFFLAHCFTLAFVGALFLGGVGLVNGTTMVEKILTELVMPGGMIWLTLLVLVYFCFLNRQAWPALVGLGCWVVLTIAGNSFVSNWLISTLEAPYQNTDVFAMAPLDHLVVLGGGTCSRLSGQSQLAQSGDRVALAARLFHAGLARVLICTGSDSFRTSVDDLHPREEGAEILIGLGVPSQSVLQIAGINTLEEMKNLKTLLANTPDTGRTGLLTSAFHMSRALRLAHANGLELTPVPANFYSQPNGPSPNSIVPGADQIKVTALTLKEYLARLVNR